MQKSSATVASRRFGILAALLGCLVLPAAARASAPPSIYDVDENGSCAPLTDGVLVLRRLFGFDGAALIAQAIGGGADRTTAPEIESYLASISPSLDVDGNGMAVALTDGVLLVRYLFGFRGPVLIEGAIEPGAPRDTALEVESWLANCGQGQPTPTATPTATGGPTSTPTATPTITATPTSTCTSGDVPDDGFVDQNCDGIDGTVADGIFVATDGSDTDPGTMAQPVKTIGTALSKADSAGKSFVYISDGTYSETVALDASNQGIGLHGGYRRSLGWMRDGTRAVIQGPRTGALHVDSVVTATRVEYLRFEGAAAATPSTSSYGIVVTDSSGFVPRFVVAVAGNGAAGAQGASAGAAGDDGGDGTVGANGFEDDDYVYCEGNVDPPLTYAGGLSCVGALASTKGGDGKRGCKTNGSPCAGSSGEAGSPNPADFHSDAGGGASGGIGGFGQPGADGAAGGNGSAGSGGMVSGGEWVPASGGDGVRGGDGTGGGGGAGGGSTHSIGTCGDWGGGGGGGGGGGCGGTGGIGGSGGGASIAILLIDSQVVGAQIDVRTGNGGEGGAGRNGGGGGPGGSGKSGGNGYDESSAGGPGGDGGDGADGGDGGGGAGGSVVGVYRSGGSTWSATGLTSFLGTPGNGGASSGNSGVAGGSDVVF